MIPFSIRTANESVAFRNKKMGALINFQRDKLCGRELVLSCLDSKATTIARSRFVVVPIAPIKELWVVLT